MGLFTKLFGTQIELDIASSIERVMEGKLREAFAAIGSVEELASQKAKLTSELHRLQREKETLSEDMTREKLTMEHKLGLERRRQEQDAGLAAAAIDAERVHLKSVMEIGIREAKVEAREEALKETRELMGEQIEGLTGLVDTLTKALPSAEIIAKVKGHV